MVLWVLRQGALDIIMALQVAVDARTVGHKHQVVMEELTRAVEAEVALITILTTKEVMVVRGL